MYMYITRKTKENTKSKEMTITKSGRND